MSVENLNYLAMKPKLTSLTESKNTFNTLDVTALVTVDKILSLYGFGCVGDMCGDGVTHQGITPI